MMILLIILFSRQVFASYGITGQSLYYPNAAAPAYKISFSPTNDIYNYGVTIFNIPKMSLNKYLGDDDSVFFKSGYVYLFNYQNNLDLTENAWFYYYWGFDVGFIHYEGYQFNEDHPLMFLKGGIEARKNLFQGEVFVGTSLNLGVTTYLDTIFDLILGFNPRFMMELPVYFGYRITL